MSQKQTSSEEMFLVVDEYDQPLAPLPRRLVHGHGVWHRVAHIWIVNSRGQILCQRRSLDKEVNPGFWEPFFGGHMGPNESYEGAARRELIEELGIELAQDDFQLFQVFKFADPTGYNNEFQAIFVVRWNGERDDIHFQDGEVAGVEWKQPREIRDSISQARENGWTFLGYEFDCLDYIEQLGRER